jgi:O-methyltransferase
MKARRTTGNSLRAGQRVLQRSIRSLYRAVRRTRPGNAAMGWVERRSPARVQHWVEARRRKLRVWGGDIFVPEDQITDVYRQALEWLEERRGREAIGDYLEFGVYIGTSLMCMHRVVDELGLQHVRLFGFDSFEGLPEPTGVSDDAVWEGGAFKADYESVSRLLTQQGVNWEKTVLVPGWFDETLDGEVVERYRLRKASVIMVDCDMYASARTVLAFCAPLIAEEAVVIFDDWNSFGLADRDQGEKRAFEEFLAGNPDLTAGELATYGEVSKAFTVTRSADGRPV